MSERIFIPTKVINVTSCCHGYCSFNPWKAKIGVFHHIPYRMILSFAFRDIPIGLTTKNAILTLNIKSQVNPVMTKLFTIHKIIEKWTDISFLFNTCLKFDPVPAAQFWVGPGISQVTVDITTLTSEWIKDPQRNYGLIIKTVNENIALTGVEAYSARTKDTQLWPSLDVEFFDKAVIAEVQPEFAKKTEDGLVTHDYVQFSTARELGTAVFSSFYVKNIGVNPVLVQLKVTADVTSYIDDGQEIEIASGEQKVLVPQYFGNLARIAYRSENAGQPTVLDITYVAKLI